MNNFYRNRCQDHRDKHVAKLPINTLKILLADIYITSLD